MYLDNGYRSECCYAPIRLGFKKIKNTSIRIKIWVCCNCEKRDVSIVQYSKNGPIKATKFAPLDDTGLDVVDSDA